MAHEYWSPEVSPDLLRGDIVTVRGEEARHAVSVARLRQGEQITVVNGRGVTVVGTVLEANKTAFTLEVNSVSTEALPSVTITLVQALAKGGRDERAIEQATEFQVDAIIPWQAERSVSRWKGEVKRQSGVERWNKITREASKQSLRSRFPTVHHPVDLQGLCDVVSQPETRTLVLDPGSEQPLSAWLQQDAPQSEIDYRVVVGPEGGISENELDALRASGAHPVRIGSAVLRTSSAGPAAIALLSMHLGRW